MRHLTLPRLAVALLAIVWATSAFASFRAEDWLNFEACSHALQNWRTTLLEYRFPGFFRPLFDWYVNGTFTLFGLHPWPHTAALIVLLMVDTALLAWLALQRTGDRAVAAAVAVAFLVQPNTWAWSILWISNSTVLLMSTAVLLTLVFHERAVLRAAAGRPARLAAALPVLGTVLAGLAKEEVLLLPLTIVALELPRWHRLTPAARRTALGSWLGVCATVVAYIAMRFAIAPPILGADRGRYTLNFGPHVFANLAFFAVHLLALPVAAAVLARVVFPHAWTPAARHADPGGFARMREGVIAGTLWALVAIQIYLPIHGHGYGFLAVPAMGVALAVGHALAWAAQAQGAASRESPAPDPARVLAPYALAAILLTAGALAAIGWHRSAALVRDAFGTLDATLPQPPPDARIVFLDPGARETPTGRSYFSMLFDDASPSMVRLHYRRPDLRVRQVVGLAALDSAAHVPEADAVFLARQGRLIPLIPARR